MNNGTHTMENPARSNGASYDNGLHQPRQATAFVGILGRFVQARWPATLFGHRIEVIENNHLSLAVFSGTPQRMAIADFGRISVCVGRPFFLTGIRQPNLEAEFTYGPVAERYLADIDGRFALVIHQSGNLLLATDLIGACPIYYSIQNGIFRFGTHLGLLLRTLTTAPKVNRLGVASVLLARGCLLDETHYSGIHRLPPGGYMMASWLKAEETVSLRVGRYADLRNLAADEGAPYASVEAFDALFADAVGREGYGSDAALMLSGGRDSYAIALASRGSIPAAVSLGPPTRPI